MVMLMTTAVGVAVVMSQMHVRTAAVIARLVRSRSRVAVRHRLPQQAQRNQQKGDEARHNGLIGYTRKEQQQSVGQLAPATHFTRTETSVHLLPLGFFWLCESFAQVGTRLGQAEHQIPEAFDKLRPRRCAKVLQELGRRKRPANAEPLSLLRSI